MSTDYLKFVKTPIGAFKLLSKKINQFFLLLKNLLNTLIIFLWTSCPKGWSKIWRIVLFSFVAQALCPGITTWISQTLLTHLMRENFVNFYYDFQQNVKILSLEITDFKWVYMKKYRPSSSNWKKNQNFTLEEVILYRFSKNVKHSPWPIYMGLAAGNVLTKIIKMLPNLALKYSELKFSVLNLRPVPRANLFIFAGLTKTWIKSRHDFRRYFKFCKSCESTTFMMCHWVSNQRIILHSSLRSHPPRKRKKAPYNHNNFCKQIKSTCFHNFFICCFFVAWQLCKMSFFVKCLFANCRRLVFVHSSEEEDDSD